MINGSVKMGKNAMGLLSRHSQVNWALADQAMISAVNFLTGVLLARYLGLREFGVFTMAWMAVLLAGAIQSALVALPMMSVGPKQSEEDAPTYYGSVFIQQGVVGALLFVLFLMTAFALDIFYPQWGVGALALPTAFAAMAFQAQDFVRRYFFTIGKPASAFINDTISYGGRMIFLIWLFYAGLGASANALWVISATSVLAAFAGGVCVKGIARPGLARFGEDVKRHWEFSRWLAPSTIMYWITNYFIIMAGGAVLGAGSAGALRACQMLPGLAYIIFKGVDNVATPRASRIYAEKGHRAFSGYLAKVGAFVTGVTCVFAVAIAIAPGFWLYTVYGNEYMAYRWVLIGYALASIVLAAVLAVDIGLRALENTRAVFYANLVATVFILLSAEFAIKNYGVEGVVAVTFVSNVILLFISAYGLYKVLRQKGPKINMYKILKKIIDPGEAGSLSNRFRRKRFALFNSMLSGLARPVKVLDVGGTGDFWIKMGIQDMSGIQVTLLNLYKNDVEEDMFKSVIGDATSMPQYGDDEFDIVFSNSVIEHLGDFEQQSKMAKEIQRVGKRHFVQTPNYYFPVEPHFVFPFFQMLPEYLKIYLHSHFNLGHMKMLPDREQALNSVNSIRLLTRKEFSTFFPNSRLWTEKILCFSKSFVAYGGENVRDQK